MASFPNEKEAGSEAPDSTLASEHEIEKGQHDALHQAAESVPTSSPRKVHGIAVGVMVDMES
jgi:hypothetical protein